jgi:Protein of unknown function (DUF3892)
MIDVIAIHMEDGESHLQHISKIRWVRVDNPGSPAKTVPQEDSRSDMYEFVKANPKSAFAISRNDKTWAYLEAVDNGHVKFVKTIPDSTRTDNLLSLPRF